MAPRVLGLRGLWLGAGAGGARRAVLERKGCGELRRVQSAVPVARLGETPEQGGAGEVGAQGGGPSR